MIVDCPAETCFLRDLAIPHVHTSEFMMADLMRRFPNSRTWECYHSAHEIATFAPKSPHSNGVYPPAWRAQFHRFSAGRD